MMLVSNEPWKDETIHCCSRQWSCKQSDCTKEFVYGIGNMYANRSILSQQ